MKPPLREQAKRSHFDDQLALKIRETAALIKSARYAIVLTGAGSSTPSGIPDFRTPGSGLWTKYSPYKYASLTAFRTHPEKFFQWLLPIARLLVQATPNPSHSALSSLEKHGFIKAVITQNIDCLHQKAGSQNVIEIHGSLDTLSCCGCYQQLESKKYIESYLKDGTIPQCPNCDRLLKPDVILFEEQLPIKPWLKAKAEVKNCDLLIVAGSSLTVTPASELPFLALKNHARVIVINLTPTYIDDYSEIVLYQDVSEVLPLITTELVPPL